MVEADLGVGHVVEQRLQVLVEERQPVLHAGAAVAGADRLVERIVAGGAAEQLDVAAAEQALRRLAERDLADRHQRELLHGPQRALRLGVEGLDVLERVAEEVEAAPGCAPGGKRSRMPPRTAYSPGSITVPERT